MKIWKINREQIEEVLERKGYFFCHKYKYSHDKARAIMRKLCKEDFAERCSSLVGQVNTVCIRLKKSDDV